jgi:nucleotide-binding universal stress UspA family protein
VLVPYDFSRDATRALRVAVELAAAARGRVLVVHAVPDLSHLLGVAPSHLPPAAFGTRLVADEQRRLEARVARMVGRRARPRVTCRTVVGSPVEVILDAARGATAIVMGTLGLTGLPHLVIGSVAERVVRHAHIPVLTVRRGARAAGRRVTRRAA